MNADRKYMIVTVELHSQGEQLRYESTIAEVQEARGTAANAINRCMSWMINDIPPLTPLPDGDLIGDGRKYNIDVTFAPLQ